MASGLLALLDDIATLLDDVAAMTKVAARQGAAAADEHDGDAGLAAFAGDADGVDVLAGDARDRLCRLDLPEHLDLVAQARRLLELELRRGFVHAPRQVVDDFVVAPVEHLGGVGDVLCVPLRRDEAHAGCGAAINLVLQTGTRAVGEKRVLAGPQPEQLLQQQQRLARGDGARVRPEEAAGELARATVERDARVLVARDVDERKALVVLEQDVVARLVLLDQVVFEQQRFRFRRGHRHLDARHLREQRERLVRVRTAAEIARHAVLQVTRLADVEDRTRRVVHAVDARLGWQRLQERRQVEGRRRTRGGLRRHGLRLPGGTGGREIPAIAAARPTTSRNISAVSRRVFVL